MSDIASVQRQANMTCALHALNTCTPISNAYFTLQHPQCSCNTAGPHITQGLAPVALRITPRITHDRQPHLLDALHALQFEVPQVAGLQLLQGLISHSLIGTESTAAQGQGHSSTAVIQHGSHPGCSAGGHCAMPRTSSVRMESLESSVRCDPITRQCQYSDCIKSATCFGSPAL
jgi:hypothetical protein